MKQISFSIFKIGMAVYYRGFWQYKIYYLLPAITLGFNRLETRTKIDLELNFLGFAIGVTLFKKK